MGKIFRRTAAALLIVASVLTSAAVVHAEVKNYEGVGEYYMSDFETPNTAQQRAKQRAEQNACEKAGVFVKSFSRAKNFELVEDIIETMTSGILKVVDVKFYRENFDNNTTLIRVTIQAQIDSNDVLKWLRKSETERENLVKQMEDLRRANADQERQIAELKRQLANAKTPQDEERIAQKFAAEDKIFLSNQKVSEAWQLYNQKDYNGAIRLHTEAVELNPDNALAYYGRAYAYGDLKNYPQAIADLTKAVQFDSPRLVDAYNNRGLAYDALKQYERAIADYDKALELNPGYVKAYYNRGNAYRELKQYERAIQDYDKAIQLNTNLANAYTNRGVAYQGLKQYERAIQDYDKAIELNTNYALAYSNRGWAYYCLKQYEKALKDFDKALEINPNFTLAKNNRAACLKAMGK